MKRTSVVLWTVSLLVPLCWGAAPVEAIPMVEEVVNLRARGTIAPDFTDMAHIHLVYATGSSAPGYHDRGALKLPGGTAVVGQPLPFDVTFPVTYDASDPWLTWVIVGTYHETEPDSVSVAMEPEDSPWDGHWEDYFDLVGEAVVHGYLVGDDADSLAAWLTNEGVRDPSFFSCNLGALPADESNAVIRNFSGVVVHGTATHVIETAGPIPEPAGLGLVGLAMLAAKRTKRASTATEGRGFSGGNNRGSEVDPAKQEGRP